MTLRPDQKGWVKRNEKALALYQAFRDEGLSTSLAVARVADRMNYGERTIYLIIKKAKENGTITD